MLVGKRPRPRQRPPMQRTTSMTGITVDIPDPEDVTAASDPHNRHRHGQVVNAMPLGTIETATTMVNAGSYDPRFLAMLSPRNPRSSDFLETSHFLRICGFCKRRLAPGRDIYMYKGDAAFCSVECREQQMEQDETIK